MNRYTTVFEITRFDSSNSCLPLLLLLLGIVLCSIVLVRKIKKGARWVEKVPLAVFLLSLGLFLPIEAINVISEYKAANNLLSAYKNEQYRIAEGVVQVLYQQPEGGHTKGDIIVIDGHHFEINYFVSTTAYHQTISRGGVLRDGVYAKVYHFKGNLLRIDMMQDEKSKQSEFIDGSTVDKEIANEESGIVTTWKDYIWIACIIGVNVCFIVRKVILFHYGYGIGFIDYGLDRRRLRSIVENETSYVRKRLLTTLNVLIPLLFFLGILILILVRVIC